MYKETTSLQLEQGIFRTIISCHFTFPFTATGLSKIPCIPRIADWGGLIIGVPNIEPNTPPLEIVKVPPSISSIARSPFRAYHIEKMFENMHCYSGK